jgi:hypothetical protein
VLGLLSLFVFYKKKTPIGDILYSLLLPIIGLSFFLVYLYSKGALGLYWETNYLFNIEMQEYYGNYKINVADRDVLRFSLALAIISVLCFFIKSKIYFKIISILFVFEIWQRYFYFSISPYYMLPLMVNIICLNSVIIEKIISFRKEFAILFLMLASFYAIDSKEKYLKVRNYDRSFARYIANNVTPCDYVLSGFLGNQSIVSKDPHYYWALLGHIDVAGEKMGIYSKPNVSEVVLKYKPKLIYGGTYYDNYSKNRGYTIPIQKVDDKILNEYYLPTPFSNFYLLKYEYHKKNCSYDKQKKDWLYAN